MEIAEVHALEMITTQEAEAEQEHQVAMEVLADLVMAEQD
jgi:hypothetical protein